MVWNTGIAVTSFQWLTGHMAFFKEQQSKRMISGGVDEGQNRTDGKRGVPQLNKEQEISHTLKEITGWVESL